MKANIVMSIHHLPSGEKFVSGVINHKTQPQMEDFLSEAVKGNASKIAFMGVDGEWYYFGREIIKDSVLSYKLIE